MRRTLGLDLGTNSIGWALTEEGSIKELGVRIIPQIERKTEVTFLKRQLTQKIKLSTTEIATLGTLVALTGCAIVNMTNWQFWIGSAVATLLTFLSMRKK